MKETLKMLWKEHFSEECAIIDTEQERILLSKASEMYKQATKLLTKEQCNVIEKYIETLYEIQAHSNQKAFLKGCEFTASFLIETKIFEKT